MAENPATWGHLEHAIDRALKEFAEQPPDFCGLSLVMQLANAVREEHEYQAKEIARDEPS